MQYLYRDTVGKKIILDVGENISTATTLRIYYRKPHGTSGYWEADLESARQMFYILAASDIDEIGVWRVQPYVVMGGVSTYGDIERFEVKEILP
jgi:hypothetical protein